MSTIFNPRKGTIPAGLFGALKARITDFISDLKRHMERAFGGGSGSYTAPVARALSENIERMETIRRMFDEIGEEVAEQVREPGRRAFADALRGQLDRRVQATAADEAAKWDKDHSYVPFSEVKAVETAIKFSRISAEQDAAYLAAVERGDMETTDSMVRSAAKEWGAASDERGRVVDLYHGTSEMGFTVFETNRTKSSEGLIYTTTKSNVAANYGGRNNYAGVRMIGRKFIENATKTGDIIQNAETILNRKFKVASQPDRQKVINHVRADAQRLSDRFNDLYDDGSVSAFLSVEGASELYDRSLCHIDFVLGAIANPDDYYDPEYATAEEYRREAKAAYEAYKEARRFIDEHREDIVRAGGKPVADFYQSFDVGDTLVDIEYRYTKAIDNDHEVVISNGRDWLSTRIDYPADLQRAMEETHKIGSYHLFGNLGSKPLIVDGGKTTDWLSVPVPDELNVVHGWATDDGTKYSSTDQIAKTAKAAGFTAVVIKNVYDGGDMADDYIFFDSSQLKSADPVTYDDDGNVIPLSERFNEEKKDIRFSLQAPVEETRDLIAVHNLTEQNLLDTLELGGFPSPSIAIVKAQMGHTKFGPISILFRKNTIDPARARNKVYGADAWTPTAGQAKVEYKTNRDVEQKISDVYYDLYHKYGERARGLYALGNYAADEITRRGLDNIVADLKQDDRLKEVYLLERGYTLPDVEIRQEPVYAAPETAKEAEKVVTYIQFKDALPDDLAELFIGPKPPSMKRKAFSEHENEIRDAMVKAGVPNANSLDEKDATLFTNIALRYNPTEMKTVEDRTARDRAVRETDAKGYEAWIDDLLDGIVEKKGIYNGKDVFTASGNRRSFEALHYEYNLANIVRAMNAAPDKGIGGFGNNIIGAAVKEYSSIDEVRADKERLRLINEDEYQELKKSYLERLGDIADRFARDPDDWQNRESASDLLVEAIVNRKTRSGIASYLKKEGAGWTRYSDSVVDDLIELANDVAQMPTGYFEAKPKRGVGFDEVAFAVVPDNASETLIAALKGRNVETYTYPAGDDEARKAVVNEKAEQAQDVRFSLMTSTDGETYVEVDNERAKDFDANDGRSHVRIIKDILADIFDKKILVNGQTITTSGKTAEEWKGSKDALELRNANAPAFYDKLKSIANADELIAAARDWINEEPEHERKDDIVGFARGYVNYKVGENGYSADVIVAIKKDGSALLYDLVNIKRKELVPDTLRPRLVRGLSEPTLNKSIPHPDEEVKGRSSRIAADSAFAYTATAKENEELRKTVASLSRALEKTRLQLNAAKRETVQTRSGGITDRFDARARNQLYTLAGRYIREADSAMDQKELSDRLEMVLQSVFNTEYGHLGDDTMNALADIGYDMLRQKKRHRATDTRSEFKREARRVTYYINPEEQKNLADHYGSWKNFREAARAHGVTYTTNKAYARNGKAALGIGELLQMSESNGDGYDIEHSILFDWSDGTYDPGLNP